MATTPELAAKILDGLITKSGVRDWEDEEQANLMALTAHRLATIISTGLLPNEEPSPEVFMAKYFKLQTGTAKLIKSTGGDAAITLTSVANDAYRQAVTLDLGVLYARMWKLEVEYEFAATPTAERGVHHWGSFHDTTGAGKGNTSGTDSAYTGYSSNPAAAKKQLVFLGTFTCTSQATATVQKGHAGTFMARGRHLNLVVHNDTGAAFHSSPTNMVIKLTPLEESVEDNI